MFERAVICMIVAVLAAGTALSGIAGIALTIAWGIAMAACVASCIFLFRNRRDGEAHLVD